MQDICSSRDHNPHVPPIGARIQKAMPINNTDSSSLSIESCT
jgi:hypothetical protein